MKFHFSVRACVCVYRLDSGREEKISSWRSFFLIRSLNRRISECFNLLSKIKETGEGIQMYE